MLKRINWKAALISLLWVVSLSGIVMLMGFLEVKKTAQRCTNVKVLIPGNQNFIERDEIDHILLTESGPLVGRMLNQINIHKLENVLKDNAFIEFAKVYADMDGTIRVNIKQREPVLRVFNRTGQDFYIDRNGLKIPTSENFTARVLVANGFIIEDFSGQIDTIKTKLAKDMFETTLFIKNDTLWNDQIEQIYVTKNGLMELVPRVGNHRIILGNADSLELKFRNLLAFYKKAIPLVGWDAYKTINIQYMDQVVCQKNETDSTKAIAAAKIKADSIKAFADTISTTDTISIPDTITFNDTITTALQ